VISIPKFTLGVVIQACTCVVTSIVTYAFAVLAVMLAKAVDATEGSIFAFTALSLHDESTTVNVSAPPAGTLFTNN
jgi:hypothetical protein